MVITTNRLTANNHVGDYLSKFTVTRDVLVQKRRWLCNLCHWLKEQGQLPEDWNFDRCRTIIMGDKVAYLPLNHVLITKYMASILEDTSPRIYNRVIGLYQDFFDFLITRGVLRDNPASDLEHRKETKRNMDPYRLNLRETIRLLVTALRIDPPNMCRNYGIVITLLASSIRPCEIGRLTEGDLAFDVSQVYTDRKTKQRSKTIPPSVSDTYKCLLQDPQRLKAIKKCGKAYVFYDEPGKPLTTRKINEILKEIASAAGVEKNITTYYLRRTFGTLLADSGFSLREIQLLYAHDDPKNTEAYLEQIKLKDIRQTLNKSTIAVMLEEVAREQMRLLD